MHVAPVARATNIRTTNRLARNVVSHREYIGEVTGSTAFAISTYQCNPGLPATFPWLWAMSSRYEHYRFKSLKFEYKTQAPTSTKGVVMLAFDYNVDDPAPTTKQQLLSYHGTHRAAPWTDACTQASPRGLNARNQFLVRNGFVSDAKLYDIGNFFIATVGQENTDVIGELWVSYTIEFNTPQADSSYPSGWVYSAETTPQIDPENGDPFTPYSNVTESLPCTVAAHGTTVAGFGQYGLLFQSSGTFFVSWLITATAGLGSPTLPFAFVGTADYSHYDEDSTPEYELINSGTGMLVTCSIDVTVGSYILFADMAGQFNNYYSHCYVTPLSAGLAYPEDSVSEVAVQRALGLLQSL